MKVCQLCDQPSVEAIAPKIIPAECRRFGVYVDWSGYRDGEELQPVWNQMISAWQNWGRWIGIEGYPTRVRDKAMGIVQFLPDKKVGGALATATASDGTCRQRTITFNSDYTWPEQLTTTRKVMEHEFGHFFGLSHYGGSEPSIMRTIGVDGIQPVDVQNAIRLGYQARDPVPLKPKTLTTGELTALLQRIRDAIDAALKP